MSGDLSCRRERRNQNQKSSRLFSLDDCLSGCLGLLLYPQIEKLLLVEELSVTAPCVGIQISNDWVLSYLEIRE